VKLPRSTVVNLTCSVEAEKEHLYELSSFLPRNIEIMTEPGITPNYLRAVYIDRRRCLTDITMLHNVISSRINSLRICVHFNCHAIYILSRTDITEI